MRTGFPFVAFWHVLLLSSTMGLAQSVYDEAPGPVIYYSQQSISTIWISSAPACAQVDSVQVHFEGDYPDENQVTVRLYDQSLSKEYVIWHLQSGVFERTASTTIFKGLPVNGGWRLIVQERLSSTAVPDDRQH